MYMRVLEELLLMGISSPEISFIGFGTGTCNNEIATDDRDCEKPHCWQLIQLLKLCLCKLWNWIKKGIQRARSLCFTDNEFCTPT